MIVGAALEPKLTLTCQKDGKFPDPANWDKCAKYVNVLTFCGVFKFSDSYRFPTMF